jgi:hypothetical protein
VQELALSDDHLDDFAGMVDLQCESGTVALPQTGYDEADCGNRPSMSVR